MDRTSTYQNQKYFVNPRGKIWALQLLGRRESIEKYVHKIPTKTNVHYLYNRYEIKINIKR